MNRVKTYISELDDALKGGIPKSNVVLVAGSAGSGKTMVSMNFLCQGATQNDESGIYFTLNEHEVKVQQNFKNFSFFKNDLIKKKQLTVIDLRDAVSVDPEKPHILDPSKVLNFIYDQLNHYEPQRIVIDSVSAICHRFSGKGEITKFLFDLGNLLMVKDCTALLLSEVQPGVRKYSNYGVEEFTCDGILYLSQEEKNNRLRKTLQIVKMRGTDHSEEQFLLKIDEAGIRLLNFVDK
jgi:circadian clock protein KaiC